uniref:Uncharacterized protein n=1 Tax=Timema shepardi TaxID=629360 RepID=A0A7R9APK4_TIMSH|nr:unnamed protein product [Timema shepardi]
MVLVCLLVLWRAIMSEDILRMNKNHLQEALSIEHFPSSIFLETDQKAMTAHIEQIQTEFNEIITKLAAFTAKQTPKVQTDYQAEIQKLYACFYNVQAICAVAFPPGVSQATSSNQPGAGSASCGSPPVGITLPKLVIKGHFSKDCSTKLLFSHCNGRHHKLLHLEGESANLEDGLQWSAKKNSASGSCTEIQDSTPSLVGLVESFIPVAPTGPWVVLMTVTTSIMSSRCRYEPFWSVEEPPQVTQLSPADRECEEHYRSTVKRCQLGRYEVELPFLSDRKGLFPSELLYHSLWWSGPTWLSKTEEFWPILQQPGSVTEEVKEMTLNVTVDANEIPTHWMNRFSRLSTLKRATTLILRWLDKIRSKVQNTGDLTAKELSAAMLRLVKLVQRQEFSEEIARLDAKKPCHKEIGWLNPFMDNEGFLRVGGWLFHTKLSFVQRHLLMARNHHLTNLIIDESHQKNQHPGPQNFHYMLRKQFWIMAGRNAVRRRVGRGGQQCPYAPKVSAEEVPLVVNATTKSRLPVVES